MTRKERIVRIGSHRRVAISGPKGDKLFACVVCGQQVQEDGNKLSKLKCEPQKVQEDIKQLPVLPPSPPVLSLDMSRGPLDSRWIDVFGIVPQEFERGVELQ